MCPVQRVYGIYKQLPEFYFYSRNLLIMATLQSCITLCITVVPLYNNVHCALYSVRCTLYSVQCTPWYNDPL